MSNGLAGGDMAGNVGGDFVRVPRFLFEDSPQLAKKVADFEELQRKAQEAAAVIGDVSEIASIKEQAKQARDEADTALAEALEKGNSIVEEAKSQAQLIVEKSTQEAGKLTTEAQNLHASAAENSEAAKSAVAAVESDKRANEARAGELDGQKASLQQKADALASREQELKGEFEKLAEVRGLIDNVLA
jgi:cell division septum initiation protein DivIVA